MRISLLLIATGKYDVFLQPLIDSVEKYFFKDDNVEIFLFSDKVPNIVHSERITIFNIPIEHKPFPYSTLYRYKYFFNIKDCIKTDYVFYCDVDMLFVDHVGREILPTYTGLVAVQHPGFAKNGGWGSPNVFKESMAYVAPENRGTYCAGGFQGGHTFSYLTACSALDHNITIDESNGVMAEWHDESHWNSLLSHKGYQNDQVKILSHEYCMSDADISGSPKLLALTKDHGALRS
jgi:hypothetical protein